MLRSTNPNTPIQSTRTGTDDTCNTRLLTEKQAGKRLGFSPRTLQKWRWTGGGPRFVQVSARCVRYRRCDLDAWVEERLRTSTSDQGAA